MKKSIIEDAAKIAAIVQKTDTDDRGLLFMKVAENLKINSQGDTGRLFTKIGNTYGFNQEDLK